MFSMMKEESWAAECFTTREFCLIHRRFIKIPRDYSQHSSKLDWILKGGTTTEQLTCK